eukprot:scaffold20827_cov84-Amphora_coffeaeformis.AAC.1
MGGEVAMLDEVVVDPKLRLLIKYEVVKFSKFRKDRVEGAAGGIAAGGSSIKSVFQTASTTGVVYVGVVGTTCSG